MGSNTTRVGSFRTTPDSRKGLLPSRQAQSHKLVILDSITIFTGKGIFLSTPPVFI
jgi:hypothetical protein